MPDVEEHSVVMAAQWTGAGENARVFQYNSDGKTMRFGDKVQSNVSQFPCHKTRLALSKSPFN